MWESGKNFAGKIRNKCSSFSVKMFLMILICVVFPLTGAFLYVNHQMENILQNKIGERIIQNISRSERDIIKMLQDMSILSNTFVMDEELIERMKNESYTSYENVRYFNRIMDKMLITSGSELVDEVKITIFDNYDRICSNWSLNYENYRFLLEEEWVRKAAESEGHMVWSMFSPPYISEDQRQEKTYISLARPVLEQGTSGDKLGVLIMSIEQSSFSEVLSAYTGPEDNAYVCVGEGKILLSAQKQNLLTQETIQEVYYQTEGEAFGNRRQKIEGEEYLICYYTLPGPWLFDDQPMKIFLFTNYREVTDEVDAVMEKMNGFIIAAVFIAVVLAFVSVKIFVKPVIVLADKMKEYTLEKEIDGIDIDRKDEIGHLNRAFIRMSENMKHMFTKLDEESKIKEQYRYESLRAQFNPHFLFNTLTSIRWMAMIRGSMNIVESIDALANVLKYSLSYNKELVMLKQELDNIRNFVFIHNLRYENKCVLEIDIPEDMQELRMMKFILQPIVENSIIHGMDKEKKKLNIRVYGYTEEDVLLLFVEDDGIGITQEAIEAFSSSEKTGSKMTGIGLKNVDVVIRLTFGEAYGLTVEGMKERGTCVTYRLPVIEGENHEKDYDRR